MSNITYIYLVENCFNNTNKVYVGKTTNFVQRKSKHKQTYGQNIKMTIIDEIQSIDRKVWRDIESMWIWSFISWGFDVENQCLSGGSGPEYRNEEFKQNHSKKMKEWHENNSSLSKENGKKQSETYKQNPEIIKERNKKHSETLQDPKLRKQMGKNISKSKRNKSQPNKRKAVIMMDLKGNIIKEFEGVKWAAEYINVSPIIITRCCQGKNKQSKGFKFKYKLVKNEKAI
jgi:hypothetical protein